MIPNEKDKVQECLEFDCPDMFSVIGIVAGPESEVESKLYHVRKMGGFWGQGQCYCGQNGVDYAKGDDILFIEIRFLDAVFFNRTGEAPVQFGVVLGVWGVYWFREAIEEVGCHNRPPCINKQLFSKSVQALIVLVSMAYYMYVHTEDLEYREG